jgi:hypothetical protein
MHLSRQIYRLQSGPLEARSPTPQVLPAHAEFQLRKNALNFPHSSHPPLRVLRGRPPYRFPQSHLGKHRRSSMTQEPFSSDCEQVTPLSCLSHFPPHQKNITAGVLLQRPRMLSKLIITQSIRPMSPLMVVLCWLSDRQFGFEAPRSLDTSMGGETHHWPSERSRSQDSSRLSSLAHRRPSDSSSAVTSPSTSFLLSTPDGVSPSDPSPVLPLTPHTSAPLPREPHESFPSSMKERSGNHRTAISSHTYTDAPGPGFGYDRDRPQSYGRRGGADAFPLPPYKTEISPTFHEPARLWEPYGVNHASSRPVRPW